MSMSILPIEDYQSRLGCGFSFVRYGLANQSLNHSSVPGLISCFLMYSALPVPTAPLIGLSLPSDVLTSSTPASFLKRSNSTLSNYEPQRCAAFGVEL